MPDSADPSSAPQPSSLGHTPSGEKWQFDESVTQVFDDMLARSIPQYEVMRQAVTDTAFEFVRPGTDVVDLGCSRGEALAPLVEKFGAYNHFIGVEMSPPMLEAVRSRFKGLIDVGVVDIRKLDLRKDYPPARASLTLSVLTVQFTPMEYRQRIVRNVYEHTLPQGAFIMVEKVIGATTSIDELMVKLYLKMKSSKGYTADEIERKRLALEGVLVPVTSRWNEDLLRTAGFREVDCFWRWMNFAAWIAIR
ncbi:MAG: methyltransferase domain-containing protein [Acidobacteriota bacterium]